MYKIAYIAIFAVACSDPPKKDEPKVTVQDLKRDAEKTVDTAGKLATQTKDEWVAKTDARLKKLDAEVDALKASAAKKQGAAKKATEDQLQELKKQRDSLGHELENVKKETGDKWEAAQKKLDATVDAFDAGFQEMKKRLEKL